MHPKRLVRSAGNAEVGLADARLGLLVPRGVATSTSFAESVGQELALLGGAQQLIAFA